MGSWKCHGIVTTSIVRKRKKIIFSETSEGSLDSESLDDLDLDYYGKTSHVRFDTRKTIQKIATEDDDKNEMINPAKKFKSRYRAKRLILGALILAGILVFFIAGTLIDRIFSPRILTNHEESQNLVPPDPEVLQLPTWSKLRIFKRGAVCADAPPCAQIGKSMLDRNGSAMDATLAAMICNGLVTMQSMGIGGGFLMTLYERSSSKSYFLNARETAPINSRYDMYANGSKTASRIGPLAIGVPGEIAGYWEAHRKFGKLHWAELFYPSIEICRKGFNMTKPLFDTLSIADKSIREDPTLRKLFVDRDTNAFKPAGSLIRPSKLCDTMQLIAENDASIFYNGDVGERLVKDLRKRGSILTIRDLNEYKAKWSDPIKSDLPDGEKLITSGLPSSGPLLAFILNVLQNFRFSAESLADFNNTIITYHRIIETFKYAYAMRTQLADGDFVDLSEILEKLTSKDFARSINRKISDERTFNDVQHYGATNPGPENYGTAHISVLAPNGDAVSVTSSVNFYFGSGIVSESTGILMNSAMDDFGIPSVVNYFGIPPSENNNIAPGKRSYSSMAPSIILGKKGDVRMVLGAAGGTKITTAIAYVIARHLWMKNTIKEAVDASRIHHQIFPMEISYEYGIPRKVVEGLAKLGHKTSRYRDRGSVVCAIVQINRTIYANADYRKFGDVYGID